MVSCFKAKARSHGAGQRHLSFGCECGLHFSLPFCKDITDQLRLKALRLAPRRPAALVGDLQEQQVGELLDIVALAHAVALQHVAAVPEFLDDGG